MDSEFLMLKFRIEIKQLISIEMCSIKLYKKNTCGFDILTSASPILNIKRPYFNIFTFLG